MNEDTTTNVNRGAILGDTEDEEDLVLCEKALSDYIRDSKTYTLEEVEKEILGIT